VSLASYIEFALEQLLGFDARRPILPTVYETSWAARIMTPDGESLYPHILEGLSEDQYPDGSWGSKIPYYHDRVLTTLAMVLALAHLGHRSDDDARRRAGERYLWQNAPRLRHDPHRTVGFELILPTLLTEGLRLGLNLPGDLFSAYYAEREEKLALLPEDVPFGVQSSALFSLEAFAEPVERADPDRIRTLLLEDGSVATSPSATAFLLVTGTGGTSSFPESHDYIRTLIESYGGRLPTVAPCDIFTRAWTLNYLHYGRLLGGSAGRGTLDSVHRYLLESLHSEGVGWSSTGPVESDDTAMVLLALHRAGYEVDGSRLLAYERPEHFAVLEYERDPSVSVNLHILEALDTLPFSERARVSQKIIGFLLKSRQTGGYWRDKWHASAYYPTSRALLVLSSHLPREQLETTVRWMLATQDAEGSWGEYGPTAEETALVLLSLLHYHRHVATVPRSSLHRAASYLMSIESPFVNDYQELWISKTLYAPAAVIRSIVIAALGLYEDTFGEDREPDLDSMQLSSGRNQANSELFNNSGSRSRSC